MNIIKRFAKHSNEVLNLGIRVAALGGKFLIVFYITKIYGEAALGEFGLFSTSVVFAMLAIGFDFYTYANRELVLKKSAEERLQIVYNQSIFYLSAIVISYPLLYLLFYYEFISSKYLFLFYGMLLVEHFSQEGYRLLIILQKPLIANTFFFIRSSAWAIILVICYLIGIHFKQHTHIYIAWFAFSLLSLILTVFYLRRLFRISGKPHLNIQKEWIKKGLKTSSYYLLATLSYNFILYGNRYLLDIYGTKEEVGIYTFFSQISNLLYVVVSTAVIFIDYPKLVEQASHGDTYSYTVLVKMFKKKTMLWSLCTLVLLLAGGEVLIHFMRTHNFEKNIATYYCLLAANFILTISLIYHYILYSIKRDAVIMRATITSVIVFILTSLILIPQFNILGAALSTLIAFLTLLIEKMRKVPRKVILP